MNSFSIKSPAALRRKLVTVVLTALAIFLIAGPWAAVAYSVIK